MTFAALTSNVALMREREGYLLTPYTDEELADLYTDSIAERLQLDVCEALMLDPTSAETTAILDEVATRRTAQLTLARTSLHLARVFEGIDYGASFEVNQAKAAKYWKEYAGCVRTFSGLRDRESGRSTTIIKVRRM